ncbi:hypothetical protein J2X71_001071 [Rhizobium sp. 1399]|nr:hypothetical protein [Rhizobium sp. 1399]
MTPSGFFETAARPNLKLAIEEDDDYRLAVNAILSVDAFYGILFEYLKDTSHLIIDAVLSQPSDSPRVAPQLASF